MRRFLNPNVKGGLRWIHIHLGLVLALLASIVFVGAQVPRLSATLPTRPASAAIVAPPVTFAVRPHLVFVKSHDFCQIHAAKCRVPVAPTTSDITKTATQSGWYVTPFYAVDTGVRIDPIINAAGDYYNIWPVYLLAVILAESGGNQYAWHDWGWPDISGGFTQETVQTLGGYGICNDDIACARAWESDPTNSIWMGARILRDYMNITGVGYPALWECYNAGPGSCRSPYYSAFLNQYYRALTYGSDTGVIHGRQNPTPAPSRPRFGKLHARIWSQYRNEHHLSFIPHNGYFAWHVFRRGNVVLSGGIVQQEQYDTGNHVMTENLQGGWSWWWPGHPTWGAKWKGHPWLR